MGAPGEIHGRAQTLDDKYQAREGWLYMTGIQALVRLPMQQRQRDLAAGHDTGGYISGYRGSPLGRYDMELWAAAERLKEHKVVFRSGLNEDLAATAIWGSQYVGLFPGAKVDGVFGIWYGKGPGVDRSGDALRHANMAGTRPLGGVVALAGDDHGVKSSTVANFSDQMFIAVGMPVLYPSNTQELLDFGLHGFALSRFSGCWVGMKVVTDVVEGGGSVWVAPDSPKVVLPADFPMPPGGLNSRAVDMGIPQEDRLYHHKLHAALAYARLNGLNRVTMGGAGARVGIVSAGKAYQDVLQALMGLGIDDARARALGLKVLKIGMTWPLDPEIVREFAQGLDTLVVIEEKRPVLEEQVRAVLYGTPHQPAIVGKHFGGHPFEAQRAPMAIPNAGETNPAMVAAVLAKALGLPQPQEAVQALSGAAAGGLALPAAQAAALPAAAQTAPLPVAAQAAGAPVRMPGFCSGCPHNRSTRLPEGSRALAGIGCHSMALLMDPLTTTTISHMGAEGVMWLGQHPFTEEKHVFANLGDGTYAHSGFLAVRQAIAAHVPLTYKILFNGFVSMTGGQAVEGDIGVSTILHELAAEGVRKMALVTDDPAKYEGVALPPGVPVRHRSELEAVQREFREYPDVSVIVYEQPCATERRRLRKRGKWEDPQRRNFINAAVCEGCGDCGKASNCMSVEPLETEFGRKRRINQSTCNKDYSCVEGFCPSFVSVEGGQLRKAVPAAGPAGAGLQADDGAFAGLPEPSVPQPTRPFNVLIGGIGGTGVVTIGQTLAVAAHLEGLYSSNLDVTGLAQKYGAVLSHVRIAARSEDLHGTRIAPGEADTLVGCDLIVAAGDESMSKLSAGRSRGVVCTDLIPTGEFARNPDWRIDAGALSARLSAVLGDDLLLLEGQRLATALMGDSIAANMFMLGAAWQRGQIPLSLASIDRAIELNGVAVELNRRAFLWGRRAAHDPAAVEERAARMGSKVLQFVPRSRQTLEDIVERRVRELTDYQDAAYARRYSAMVERVRRAEDALGQALGKDGDALSRAVARYHFKLLAAKDEFEVARLYSRPQFREELAQAFEGDYKLKFHVGAWPFARKDPATGKPVKREVGPWLMSAFGVMARLRFLRGSVLDPFRNSAERRLNRALLEQYEQDLERVLAGLTADRHAVAVRIASLPEKIRGYGHVREEHAAAVAPERERLLEEFSATGVQRAAA
ncbi:indolepyruvate ferredoxin oxidoreductase family protein [Quisquiliibacterium transsilvanicum]|uniref:Indolepyruvate ferredoxin oxidoreductase n=2 Tax=Quisquiliibacterium transsilvanicum TaxID=1549638 RepID=A0A7W8HH80_9BURK|nr:indolepyruvate ferredoxin oxidoreductase family protein [Quisquiliibacterium transsilvanicum]MBB5272014.1 indolepyruvate ferredoxin oxidoreductase [Quisquiliibacterium transsilvanicum]